MRYAFLLHETPEDLASRDVPESHPYVAAHRAYYKAMVAAGAFVGGAPLKAAETATTVRLKDGRRQVQDGPYADAKEQLGGFVILDLPTLDAALEWAARCPTAATGAVEVRPVDVASYEVHTKP